MNDVKDLLGRALGEGPDFGPEPLVDPAADLARGRTRLHRRRSAIISGATAAVLVAGLVPLALTSHGGSSSPSGPSVAAPRPPSVQKKTPASSGPALQSIALVSYTGKQPKGYKVSWVPDGWVIQGVDTTALTIAPKGDKDKDPSSFRGKLAVLSASEDETHTLGKHVSVDGRAGYLRIQEGLQMLSYKSSTGRWVDIQAPLALGWSTKDLLKFASGITVLKDAANTYG